MQWTLPLLFLVQLPLEAVPLLCHTHGHGMQLQTNEMQDTHTPQQYKSHQCTTYQHPPSLCPPQPVSYPLCCFVGTLLLYMYVYIRCHKAPNKTPPQFDARGAKILVMCS